LVNLLKKKGKIIISSEGKLPEEFEKYKYKIAPEKIHHVLYYANMYIGESGTMATEAAVLGTPTIHIGPLVKYGGVHIDQSKKYGLKFIFTNFDDAFKRVKELLQINPIKLNNEWKIKRGRLIKDKTDIAEFILKLIDKEID
jgi:predicted glycosyltransferase